VPYVENNVILIKSYSYFQIIIVVFSKWMYGCSLDRPAGFQRIYNKTILNFLGPTSAKGHFPVDPWSKSSKTKTINEHFHWVVIVT